jgi:hypothetical protein
LEKLLSIAADVGFPDSRHYICDVQQQFQSGSLQFADSSRSVDPLHQGFRASVFRMDFLYLRLFGLLLQERHQRVLSGTLNVHHLRAYLLFQLFRIPNDGTPSDGDWKRSYIEADAVYLQSGSAL